MPASTPMPGQEIPKIQKVIAIFWPSFITAGIATILFFTAFDPILLFPEYDLSRLGMYSTGFFIFWLLTGVSSGLSLFFSCPCDTFNQKN